MIVESPAKAHTIQKYLGPDYEVMASMGHVRDLPASRLSVDVKNDFAPNYENIKGKGELIKSCVPRPKRATMCTWRPTPIVRERPSVGTWRSF